MNKLLVSSINPEKLSLTVKGILLGIIPVILIVAGIFNLNVSEGDLTSVVNAVVQVIVAVGAAASAILTLIGAIRKVIVGIKKKSAE